MLEQGALADSLPRPRPVWRNRPLELQHNEPGGSFRNCETELRERFGRPAVLAACAAGFWRLAHNKATIRLKKPRGAFGYGGRRSEESADNHAKCVPLCAVRHFRRLAVQHRDAI